MYEWFLSNTRATNTPPVANAGIAQSITLPVNTGILTGSGTGTSGATISSYSWIKTSGPAAGSISTANAASTGVTGLVQGIYVFTLTVTDNHGLTGSASVTVTVIAAPVADPGPNQTISSTSTVLNATASYSLNGSITSYNWQQVSGPGSAIIANASSPTATISNMVTGSSYAFKLTVTDVVGATGSAITDVTVMNALLPVEFTYFKAQKTTAGNLLQWGTVTEQNNDYFAVERSEDGNQFTTIDKVAGAGAGNAVKAYTYTDTKAAKGNVYYRLRQVDKDGQFKFSKLVLISNINKGVAVQMYPNPVQDNLTLVANKDVKGKGKISIYDLTGRAIRQQTIEKNDKLLNEMVDMNNLTPGLYIVEIKIGGTYKLTERIMKK
jgi:hypothetical protein